MAITTGAATTDNLNGGGTLLNRDGPAVAMIWAWIKPSTFTSGRAIHPNLKLNGTSELRLLMSRLTTQTELVTTGAGIIVNEWVFVCTASICTTAAQDSRVWVGRIDTPPAKMPLTLAVAGAGGFLAASMTVIGNLTSAGTTAFQGTSDGWGGRSTTDVTMGAGHPFGLSSLTALTADDDQFLLDRFVVPAWQGRPPTPLCAQAGNSSGKYGQITTDGSAPYQMNSGMRSTATNAHTSAATVVGTVASQERHPRATKHIDFPYLRR